MIVESGLLRMVRIAGHIRHEIAIVDAVLSHIQEKKSAGWPRIDEVTHFQIHPPDISALRAARSVPPAIRPQKSATPEVHGHAPHAGHHGAIEPAAGRSLDFGKIRVNWDFISLRVDYGNVIV